MDNKHDREYDQREFKRFQVELSLDVSGENTKGEKFTENAILENISGGGAQFMSRQADKYYPGQSLEITIYLPGTVEVKACMRGLATVVRIDSQNDSGLDDKSRRTGIAVAIKGRLRFERVNSKTQENRKESRVNP